MAILKALAAIKVKKKKYSHAFFHAIKCAQDCSRFFLLADPNMLHYSGRKKTKSVINKTLSD